MGLGQLDIFGYKDQQHCRSNSDSGGEDLNREGSISPETNKLKRKSNIKNDNESDDRKKSSPKIQSTEDDDQQQHQWSPNKTPKLHDSPNNHNNNIDQATEATIRKARVSVRARSQAPVVIINFFKNL